MYIRGNLRSELIIEFTFYLYIISLKMSFLMNSAPCFRSLWRGWVSVSDVNLIALTVTDGLDFYFFYFYFFYFYLFWLYLFFMHRTSCWSLAPHSSWINDVTLGYIFKSLWAENTTSHLLSTLLYCSEVAPGARWVPPALAPTPTAHNEQAVN